MREIVRAGLVRNNFAHEHCFVPSGQTRRVLNAIDPGWADGEQSLSPPDMYSELASHLGSDKATFNLSFDLPFLAIAGDEKLQYKFFRRSLRVDEDEDSWEE